MVAASTTTQELVAAASGQIVRVLAFCVTAVAASASAIFKSGTTSISGTINLSAGIPAIASAPPIPTNDSDLFRTAVGEALNVTSVGNVGGYVVVEVLTQTP